MANQPTSSLPLSTLSFVQHHHESDLESENTMEPTIATSSQLDAIAISNYPQPEQEVTADPDESSPPKMRIAIIMSCLCACVFVAAIDVTIISIDLPAIAENFQSASSYQWVTSAYVLGTTATIPSWGKVSDIWGRKPILLLANIIFFTGRLICAAGENIAVFLTGRAIQGVGASGLLTLVNITISDIFSMRDRAFYFGLTSVVWATASGIGPVLGGVFAEQLTWRWCFWINLPVSGVVLIFLFFTMPEDNPGTFVWAGLKALDWSGSLLIMCGTVMLLLGLTFGSVTFAWNSATVVNLIVFGVFAGFLFGLNEWKLVKYPVIPPRLFHNWSSSASFAICFCHWYTMMGVSYYLPLYFRAVLRVGPLRSGLYLLPFILSNSGMAATTGLFIQKTGRYIPAVYHGLLLMTIGTGLLINLNVNTNWPKIVIYQIIVGSGIGMNFEGPLLALQASVDVQDVATATATMSFTRMLASAISAVIGGVVFQNQMVNEFPTLAVLGPEIASLFQGGDDTAHVGIIRTLPLDQQLIARGAFYRSLRTMWIMYVAFAILGLIGGIFIGVHPLSKDVQPVQFGLVTHARDNDRQTTETGMEVAVMDGGSRQMEAIEPRATEEEEEAVENAR